MKGRKREGISFPPLFYRDYPNPGNPFPAIRHPDMIRYPSAGSSPLQWVETGARFLVLAAAVYFFSFVTADPDLWGHIRFGKDLWQAGQFIRQDPYSFTAYGLPWVNHEWLSELIFYGVYHHTGDAGLLLGKLGIGLCSIALLTRICRYRKPIPVVYAIVMMMSVSAISPGFMIRPQLFSFLFFTLFLHLFHLYFEQGRNRLFLLPALMVVWVNLHGGFLMGWALMTVIVAWKTLSRLTGIEQGGDLKTIWIWFGITSLAVLVNPGGHQLPVFLYRSLSISRDISEWAPLPLWDRSMLGLKILMLLTAGCILKYRSIHTGWEIAGILLTLYATLRHQRHMPFFAIMAAPYGICCLSSFIRSLKVKFPQLVLTEPSRYILIVFFCVQTAFLGYHGAMRYVHTGFRILVDPDEYPVQAVAFIKTNGMTGNLLLPFEWGEYAIWHLAPNCKVSIDGRFRTVYPEAVIRDHFVANHDNRGWLALITKYPADILLVRQIPFFQHLVKDPAEWTYVYSDSIGIVFIRNSIKNRKILTRFRAGDYTYPASAPSIYFP